MRQRHLRISLLGRAKLCRRLRHRELSEAIQRLQSKKSLHVIPGCALLGADPESSTAHCSGFRVRRQRTAPRTDGDARNDEKKNPPGAALPADRCCREARDYAFIAPFTASAVI